MDTQKVFIHIQLGHDKSNLNFKYSQCAAFLLKEELKENVFIEPETLDLVIAGNSATSLKLPLAFESLIKKIESPVVITSLYRIGVSDMNFRYLIKPTLLRFLKSYYRKIKN